MPYKGIAGVYVIQSLIKPERIYVGSAINIPDRWSRHRRALAKGIHENRKIQNHYNKYGKADLVFEVIESGEYFNKAHLISREQGWFYHFRYKKSEIPFFNIQPRADSPLGVRRSEETKRRVGDASRGRNVGRKLPPRTEEHRRKISVALLGRKDSEETRLRKSIGHKKENLSPSAIKNLREAQLGRKHPQEVKNKIREWNLNRPSFTEEHKKNISIGLKNSEKHKNQKRNPKTGVYEKG